MLENVKAFFAAPDLTPGRKPGELYPEYRERRRLGNEWIKRYLKGRMVWVSCYLSPDGKKKIRAGGTAERIGNQYRAY